MTSARFVQVVVAALAALSLLAPLAVAQETGSIEGVVLDAAQDAPLDGQSLRLDHFDGMTRVGSQTAVTDADGHFAFADLALGDDQIYIVRVTYAGVEYSSGMLIINGEMPAQDVTLIVAETTEDDAGIVIERMHLIVTPTQGGLEIGEMLIISNYSTEAFVGTTLDSGVTVAVRLPLPPSAEQVTMESGAIGDRFVEVDGGIATTYAVPPGESVDQTVMSYYLPASGASPTVAYDLPYPVKALNVLLASAGWELSSDQLTFQGAMGGENGSFLNYAGSDLQAGERLLLAFTPGEGQPADSKGTDASAALPAMQASDQGTLLKITMALGGALLLAVATYPIWRGAAIDRRNQR